MMIRKATLEDVPALVAMGKTFVKDLPLPAEVDEDTVVKLLSFLVTEENGCLLVNDDVTAAIGGMSYPYYFNANITVASELFWWVSEPARRSGTGLELLDEFEVWAKEVGASVFSMLCLEGKYAEPLTKLYLKKGFIQAERQFMKEI